MTTPPVVPPIVFTAHDVPDLLAAVPTFFGFTPTESLVAVATYGDRRRFGFRLRLDVPPLEAVPEAAEVVVGHLARQGPDGVVLLALSRDVDTAAALVRATMDALPAEIEPVVCAWADGERYWEPFPGFPADGLPYEASPHHRSIVAAIAAGQELLPDREALVARMSACEGTVRARMQAVTDRVVRERVGRLAQGVLPAALAELDPLLADVLTCDDRLTDEAVAVIAFWVSSIEVRDELWSRMDRESAHHWSRLLRDVSGRVVAPFEPSVLSLTAFASWLEGHGAQALIAAERAQAADPRYSMAELMLELVTSGLPPTAWIGGWTEVPGPSIPGVGGLFPRVQVRGAGPDERP